jgi:hypothetical protein
VPLTLAQTQAISDLAEFIADYLPGKPHPFADPAISFPGVASRIGVGAFWPQSGSKVPSVTTLLERTLDREARLFCNLVLEIVRVGLKYRQRKNPITREDVETLDALVRRVGFGIKDFRDPVFLNTLPASPRSSPAAGGARARPVVDPSELNDLKRQFQELAELAPVVRGFEFEKFLGRLFEASGLAPRSAFKMIGEQIDGSFELQGQTYLVEAKWQGMRLGQADLLVFSGKVSGKAQWARGLVISYSGYSDEGLHAFRVGKQTNIVCMDRSDLRFVLDGRASLADLIARKARRAVEENSAFVPAETLFQ